MFEEEEEEEEAGVLWGAKARSAEGISLKRSRILLFVEGCAEGSEAVEDKGMLALRDGVVVLEGWADFFSSSSIRRRCSLILCTSSSSSP